MADNDNVIRLKETQNGRDGWQAKGIQADGWMAICRWNGDNIQLDVYNAQSHSIIGLLEMELETARTPPALREQEIKRMGSLVGTDVAGGGFLDGDGELITSKVEEYIARLKWPHGKPPSTPFAMPRTG